MHVRGRGNKETNQQHNRDFGAIVGTKPTLQQGLPATIPKELYGVLPLANIVLDAIDQRFPR